MAVRLAIDGYNLIGSARDVEEAREALIRDLSVYKRLRKVRITVVFDGTHSGRLQRGKENRKGIDVIFSKNGEEADHILKRMAKETGRSLTIVTSDHEITVSARASGAVVISSDEFRNLLEKALYEDMKGLAEDDDEDTHEERGPSRKLKKAERAKAQRIKKL